MKKTELEKIHNRCRDCHACPLGESRTNIVFGKGSPDADIMFIGEAPGEKEDLSGEPFVGAAGKLLDKYLEAVGIDKDTVYIANIIKCRPPKNRDPLPSEEEACIPYLREQLSVIKPKIIVCLGRISAKKIIKEDFKITAEHGKWFKKGPYMICAVYHPAALLRDPRKKEEELCDFKNIAKMRENLQD